MTKQNNVVSKLLDLLHAANLFLNYIQFVDTCFLLLLFCSTWTRQKVYQLELVFCEKNVQHPTAAKCVINLLPGAFITLTQTIFTNALINIMRPRQQSMSAVLSLVFFESTTYFKLKSTFIFKETEVREGIRTNQIYDH